MLLHSVKARRIFGCFSPLASQSLTQPMDRKLAAILAADVVGYSRLKSRTRLERLRGSRSAVRPLWSRSWRSITGASSS
jgi:hypothetical protein